MLKINEFNNNYTEVTENKGVKRVFFMGFSIKKTFQICVYIYAIIYI